MSKINPPPSLEPIESIINRAKAKDPLMAYELLGFVKDFEKEVINYPKPLSLSENDELAIIDDYFIKYREILTNGHLLYGLIVSVDTYYRENDPKNKQESIDRLEKVFTMLRSDIIFISRLKDGILVKKEIELANKALKVSIVALIIAIISVIIAALSLILKG